MKIMYKLVLMSLMVFSLNAQDNFNFELISNVEIGEVGNDCWGWVHPDGVEYAIMGSRTNTWVWSLEDPANPVERARISGDASTWRDIKSWQDHIYVTTDSGDDGLLVIDMSQAPDSIRFQYITPPIITATDTTALGPCHNLYIDENGFCYLAGCRISQANKAIIFDLNQDKWNPPIVGVHGNVPGGGGYAHDLYVKNNIMYSSEINDGHLAIYDCTRKDSLVALGTKNTGFNFTHNAWSSTDQNFVFTTDERPNAFVEAYDVSDPSNITFLDAFQPLETRNRNVIPHNTHYYDGYLVTSYYTDGIIITDASKPDNLIKVGAYDTFDGPDGGFQGCWGAYPFLPSGLVIASDMNTGLYLFRPTYVRAALLEGRIIRADTKAPINNAQVSIEADQFNEAFSNATGDYKTGIAEQGLFDVRVFHPDYKPVSVEAEIINGEVTILDIELEEIERVNLRVSAMDPESGNPIPRSYFQFSADGEIFEIVTDETGIGEFEIPVKTYSVGVAAWGFIAQELEFDAAGAAELSVMLEQGYADDFKYDQGWTTSSSAVSGLWERGVPNGTIFNNSFVAPPQDIGSDTGESCYVTGNQNTTEAGADDVDDGYVQLISPAANLSEYENPILRFHYWFQNTGGAGGVAPNDTLIVYLHENGDSTELARFTDNNSGWSDLVEIELADFLIDGSAVNFSFYTEDLEDSGHLLEAAIDVVSIIDDPVSSTADLELSGIEVYPNPFADQFEVQFENAEDRIIRVFNTTGQLLLEERISASRHMVDMSATAGVYWLKVEDTEGQTIIRKLVKN